MLRARYLVQLYVIYNCLNKNGILHTLSVSQFLLHTLVLPTSLKPPLLEVLITVNRIMCIMSPDHCFEFCYANIVTYVK